MATLEERVRFLEDEVIQLKEQARVNRDLIGELIGFFNALAEKMATAAGVMAKPPRMPDPKRGEIDK